jgi:PAS domain S-box-containing protein
MQRKPDVEFPMEAQKSLSGGLLRAFATGLLVMAGGFILVSILVFHELILRALILGGSASLVCAGILWLIQKERLQVAGISLVTFLWSMISIGAFTAGGLTAPIVFGYMAIILIGALILGNRSGFLVTLLTIGFGGFLVYAEAHQFLPVHVIYSPLARLFIYAFFFFVILLLQKTAVDTTRSAILRAQSSETQYRSFLENISTVTYINDTSKDSLTTYISPQVKTILGYTSEEFLEKPALWKDLIHPDDRETVFAENLRTNETGEPFTIEYRIIAKDHSVLWVRDEATLVRDEKGKPQYWLGIWTNVTERKNLEIAQADTVTALVKRTNQLQTASEVSGAATSILELNELLPKVVELIRSHFEYYYVGLFLVAENQETLLLEAATGDMGEQLLTSKHSLPIGNSSMVGWCVLNNRARISLDVGTDAVHFKNPLLPLSRSELALPLRARGHVIGAMTFQSAQELAFTEADLTALQTMADHVANSIENARLLNERLALINELEKKNEELERFSYTVSHDLKSPLVTIRGFIGYLREDAKKGDLARLDKDLARVIRATDTMQILLNDLLDLSRIGRVINPLMDIPAKDLVQDALNLIVGPLLPDKIKIDVQENLPILHCDRIRIIEVIQNLLANSIKFMGDQPRPRIKIGCLKDEIDPGFSTLFIKDNGMGIEPQYRERVFGLFNRLNPEKEGTGIGLTLVKRIIEVHGGRIWLESEGKNKGTIFYFSLPVAQNS